jgi:hypothetical protein
MGVVFGGPLRQIAKRKQMALIASIPDSAVASAARHIASNALKTEDDALAMLDQTHVPEHARVPFAIREEAEGWMTFRPFAPVQSRQSRVDRAALQNLLGAMVRTNTITLAMAGDYYEVKNRMPRYSTLDWMYLTNLESSLDQAVLGSVFSPALPILASLSPAQWESAQKGGLSWSILSGEQRELIVNWVYSEREFAYSTGSNQYVAPRQGDTIRKSERTEMLPNGIPSDMNLLIDTTRKDAVLVQAKSGFRFIFDLDSIGYHELHGNEVGGMGQSVTRIFTGYRPAEQLGYKVRIVLKPNLTSTLSISESQVRSGPFLSRAQLPEAFQERNALAKKAFGGSRD